MAANPSILPNSHPRPSLVPFVREPQAPSEEDVLAVSNAEGLTLVSKLMGAIEFEVTSIDFEVAAALRLSPAWRTDRHADVYMVRTLERIAVHMKSLQEIQVYVNERRDESLHPDLFVINRTR